MNQVIRKKKYLTNKILMLNIIKNDKFIYDLVLLRNNLFKYLYEFKI